MLELLRATCSRFANSVAVHITLLLGPAPCAIADEGTDLAAMREAWKRRETTITSARIEWVHAETITKGYLSTLHGELPATVVAPPTDVTQDGPVFLAFDRNRMRYETRRNHWSWDDGAFRPRTYISTFDGVTSSIYWPPSWTYPRATINSERHNVDKTTYHLWPVLMAFRPSIVLPEFLHGPPLPIMKDASIDGNPCVIVRDSRATGAGQRALWIEPAKDWSIVRFTFTSNDTLTIQMDIEYGRHSVHGWVPAKWRTAHRVGRAHLPQHLVKVTVHKAELNLPLGDADFKVPFAVGTCVYDERDETEYLVRDKDKKRFITAAERGASYEQLFATDSGMALRPARGGWWTWILGAAGATIILFAIAFVWRHLWKTPVA